MIANDDKMKELFHRHLLDVPNRRFTDNIMAAIEAEVMPVGSRHRFVIDWKAWIGWIAIGILVIVVCAPYIRESLESIHIEAPDAKNIFSHDFSGISTELLVILGAAALLFCFDALLGRRVSRHITQV